jgi:hypothetical protein
MNSRERMPTRVKRAEVPGYGSRLAHSVLEALRWDNGDRESPFKATYAARPEYDAALGG